MALCLKKHSRQGRPMRKRLYGLATDTQHSRNADSLKQRLVNGEMVYGDARERKSGNGEATKE